MDEHQLARIRLLSRRFVELQGLRVAFAGGTIAIVVGTYLLAATPTPNGSILALVVALVLMIPGQVRLHRYYATTFGRQQRTPADPRMLLWLLLLQLILFVAFTYVNRRFPEIPAGAPTTWTMAAAALFFAIRDWPWRAHWLGGAGVVAVAFGANVFGVDVIDPGMTLAVTLFVLGLALVAVGLLDHRLLVRLTEEARALQGAAAAVQADQ